MNEDEAAHIHTVALGLGSNLGDRDANLRAALARLAPAVTIARISAIYDTAPMLVTAQPRFHNIACIAHTTLTPLALLRHTKAVEAAVGRTPGIRYGPRVVDIDILFYDDLTLDTPELRIPHPRIAERAFVLAPLAEITPDLRHPALNATVAELARALPPADVIRCGHLF